MGPLAAPMTTPKPGTEVTPYELALAADILRLGAKEAAARRGISVNTVRVQKFRIRARLAVETWPEAIYLLGPRIERLGMGL